VGLVRVVQSLRIRFSFLAVGTYILENKVFASNKERLGSSIGRACDSYY
jgi:hypothetical protein